MEIKTVASQMLKINEDIAGSKKRHDSLLVTIGRELMFKPTRQALAKILDRKLKRDEGVILSSGMYGKFTGSVPIEGELMAFHNALAEYDLALCSIYNKTEAGSNIATFIIIHRSLDKAMDFRDRIGKIFGVTEQKPMAALVKTFIKITEGLEKPVTLSSLVTACNLLDGDEVYCVTMNVFMLYTIDPKHFSNVIDQAGFTICPLVRAIDPTTPDQYKEYESMVGFLISRTQEGINWGQTHIETVLNVCNTAEEGLFKTNTSKSFLQ